jgi:hypothetical protein
MIYYKVKWSHSNRDFPVLIFSEIDENRLQVRKVEMFYDGSYGRADRRKSIGSTQLSDQKIASLNELSKFTDLEIEEIDKGVFESIWADASDI